MLSSHLSFQVWWPSDRQLRQVQIVIIMEDRLRALEDQTDARRVLTTYLEEYMGDFLFVKPSACFSLCQPELHIKSPVALFPPGVIENALSPLRMKM